MKGLRVTFIPQTVSLLRPLVYVYELPTEFNVGMLEQRIKKVKCTVRYYGDENNTRWEPNLYGAELIVYESLLRSKHRTLNRTPLLLLRSTPATIPPLRSQTQPMTHEANVLCVSPRGEELTGVEPAPFPAAAEEADFFFVPFFASCFMSRFLGPTARHRLAPTEHTIERVR